MKPTPAHRKIPTMDPHKYLLISITLTWLILYKHLTIGLDLSAYESASFSINPSSELTHFVTHNETGIVYIGASDALYQLGEDFVRQERADTAAQCEDGIQTCPNYNKILLIDYAHDRLITCGSEKQGTCQTRDLSNVNTILYESNHPVVSSGKLTTEAIIAPGPRNGGVDAIYVSATYEVDRRFDVFALSRRELNVTNDFLFNIERGGRLQVNTGSASSLDLAFNYAEVFNWKEFTYFVASQILNINVEARDTYVSKVNRICHNTIQLERSYVDIVIECSSSGIHYNLIQAAYVGPTGPSLAASLNLTAGDDVFYGVFAENEDAPLSSSIPSSKSALCVFKMQDIEEAFLDAVFGCLTKGMGFEAGYFPGSQCVKFSVTREDSIGQQCIDQTNWQIASGITPLVSTPVIEWNDTLPSSVITTTHRDHTVAFVGTTTGDLVKVHIESEISGREYERISLGSPVLKDTEMDTNKEMVTILTQQQRESSGREYERISLGSPVLKDAEMDTNKEMVTILTQQQLLKLRVSNCAAYTTCDDCIGGNGGQDGDPYCGWCTLERRCTLHDECPMSDASTRWLPYNNAQCVSISNVAPYDSLPITETEQQITLTVEQLPDLGSGASYECIFDNIPAVAASKDGNKLTCTTPAMSDIPRITTGNDHVTMQLYVFSTETQVKFVQREFNFYECNTHKGCVACTNSSWACDWCIYSNICTHDNSTCTMEDDSIINGMNNPEIAPRQGPEECPQLVAQDGEKLVPVGASRSITVTGKNLPDEDRVTSYKCVLNIEGSEVTTAAMRSGEELTCAPRMYTFSEEIQNLDVSLSVVWNDNRILDDVFGFIVTLYKCEVNRPDCSRCLSSTTTRPELMCGWCKTNAMCTVNDNSKCSGDWLAPGTNDNCPVPILSGVWPPSGPHEGNTIISVMGTDLGLEFDDIVSVTVGGKPCDISGLSRQEYRTGSSVSCRTPSGSTDSEEDITVAIKGADETVLQSTGTVVFTYRNPSISSFEPQEGPEAGGTVVTITGQYLDACSEISATIGSECVMNRRDNVVNETTATCRTTSSAVDSTFPLVVSFDGAIRQSQDMFTYRPNPTVADVQPRKTIESGGITLTVTGTGFNLAQTPQMIMYVGDEEFTEDCKIHNDTMMICKTPNTETSSDNISRKRREVIPLGDASFGFIIGDVTELLRWADDNNVTIEYFPDPEYYQFVENPKNTKEGAIEQIDGLNLDAGSSEIDVTVYIGSVKAVVETLDESVLTITVPIDDPGRECINGTTTKHTCVVVYHGNLPPINIGTLRYPSPGGGIDSGVIIAIAVVCVILIGTLILVLVLYRRKVKGHQANIDKLLIEMEDLESNIASDIHEAFVKLQTDVTDLTSDLEGTGMPFVPHRQYAISMFFTGLEARPMTYDPEDCDEAVENAVTKLSKLLGDKTFLMAMIQILDDDKSIPNKDRLSIASMLTVLMILENKLPYLTDVMMTLMTAQVQDAIEEERPTRLFQRTELIMEKLLSNWIALSLYDFLKDHAAYPLFLLYRAIKCHTEKGPIDMVTGKSYVSLNDENIIGERLTYKELVLDIIVNEEDGEKREVAVLDTDSIGQVKCKILDTIHRNKPYSTRMQPWQVDLEWRIGIAGHLTLQDIDISSEYELGWKKVNTLKHFSVPTGANFALALRQEVPNVTAAGNAATRYTNIHDSTSLPNITVSMDDTQVEDGVQLWHLTKDCDETQDVATLSRRKSLILKKQIREVTFPRLLSTKGIVQEYMDRMFAAILNTEDVPIGVKYIFDTFDGLAKRHDIEDEGVLHKWKSNILPLRFWQKIITNPQYIFDINQPRSVEASLSVISQAFYDAFRVNNEQITKDAPYRRLLYNREIPKYRDMVKGYYSSVSQMQRITKSTLDKDLRDICIKFTGLFSRISTLIELHKFLVKYRSKLLEVLETDEIYAESGLSEKLAQVLDAMPASLNEPRYVYQQDVQLDDEQ
ncbi:plexin-A2-like [Amphiura filiformis]|uniref:plexin-A2-like n=1 Tax=Amphiura filiformis TaxID=82378 RepID=UPI003B20D46F